MRKKILKELVTNQDEFISGNELARRLGISRVAVWKHIEALKEEGYDIIGVSGKGYYLDKTMGVIIPEDVEISLKGQLIGSKVVYYPHLDSTSEALKRSLKENLVQEGTVLIAGSQNRGKGRRGRTWESPPGGLWFSFLLLPKLPVAQIALLSLTFAVALARSLESYLPVGIKWPNDVYYQNKKIAGLLLEMSGEIDRADYLIVGIGINVNIKREQLSNQISALATSILEESGQVIPLNDLLKTVLVFINQYYRNFLQTGFTTIRKEFKSFCIHLDKEIAIFNGKQVIRGINTDIDEMGNLILTNSDGSIRITSGDVRVVN